MKILQLIQKPQPRGAEIFACQLSDQLKYMGHKVIIIAIYAGEAAMPFSGQLIQLNRPLYKRWWDWQGWQQLAKIIKKENPDIIQANAGDTMKFVAFSKIFYRWKKPVVFRNANNIGDFINSKPKYWLNKFFISQTTRIISVSKLCRQNFIQTFLYPQHKIDTVQIGINLKKVNPVPEDLKFIFAQGSVLVNVASMVPEKNHQGLLRIFKRILIKIPNAQLLLIGNGPLKDKLKSIAQTNRISRKVHFLGSRNDVLQIIKGASAFLLPSYIEGLPAVILEAQFCKTPVIASNVGGISEVVKTGKTGWLVEKGDEEEFADSVIHCLKNSPEKLRKITDAAYKQVVEEYDNKIIAQRFLEVYKEVVSRSFSNK